MPDRITSHKVTRVLSYWDTSHECESCDREFAGPAALVKIDTGQERIVCLACLKKLTSFWRRLRFPSLFHFHDWEYEGNILAGDESRQCAICDKRQMKGTGSWGEPVWVRWKQKKVKAGAYWR
ncbi:hypothetical protein LCGC14_0514000 [marine sediment metagenome]|uniref:Uncharacterized protein n=1 Tax=marine sediment metagenome TaxID=412755 RepID=A0A0F9V8X7_9ZZZZ